MKKRLTLILSAVLLGTGLAAFCLTSGPCQANSKAKASKTTGKQIRWHTSINSAVSESQLTGKPILADFYATWCPPCKMMDQQTFPNAHVIAESQRWVMLKIDVDKQPEVASQYRISSLPTIAVLTPKGRPLTGVLGFAGPAELLKLMRDNYQRATTATD